MNDKVNERIRAAATKDELAQARHDGAMQDSASAKTLRKRARLVKAADKRIYGNK